jgi:hypothetical protein
LAGYRKLLRSDGCLIVALAPPPLGRTNRDHVASLHLAASAAQGVADGSGDRHDRHRSLRGGPRRSVASGAMRAPMAGPDRRGPSVEPLGGLA